MKDNYFIVNFGEDGISITQASKEEVNTMLSNLVEDGMEHPAQSFDEGKEKNYYMDGGAYPIYKKLLIKGEVIIPKATKIVEKYEL